MAIVKMTYTKPLPASAEIFKRKGETWARWKDAQGEKCEGKLSKDGAKVLIKSSVWTAKYRDASGKLITRSTGCKTKDGALRLLAKWQAEVEKVKCGVLSQAETYVSCWTADYLERHINDYKCHLSTKGTTERHIEDRETQLKRVFAECDFRRLCDLNRESFEHWINQQSKGNTAKGQKGKTMGAARRNVYHAALVAFCNWAVEAKRLTVNPFAGMHKANERADKRHERRALTEEELAKLIDAAQRRPLANALKGWRGGKMEETTREEFIRLGREHALIYKTLALTGLRRGELTAVTVGAVHLVGPHAHIALAAKDEKARRGALLPLRADLVADLGTWLAGRLSALRAACSRAGEPIPVRLPMNTPLFDVPVRLVRHLDLDLDFAEIKKQDDRGRIVDVHSFRYTFGTHLCKAGVPLRTAQAAMRHSDPKLTANVYTDPALLDVAGAINSLPTWSLDNATEEIPVAAKSGEHGETQHVPKHVPVEGNLGQNSATICNTDTQNEHSGNQEGNAENPNNCRVFQRASLADTIHKEWHPQGDSNPCRRRERAVS
jgi:integrase